MQRQPGLPVDLPIGGRAVLVAGGGPQALGKVALLRDHGAVVTVVAPVVEASIADLADRGLITWHPREPAAADLDAMWLVVAATGDPADDARISELAATRHGVVPARIVGSLPVGCDGPGQSDSNGSGHRVSGRGRSG